MKEVAEFTVRLLVHNDAVVTGKQIADFSQRVRGEGFGWHRRWKHRGSIVVIRNGKN